MRLFFVEGFLMCFSETLMSDPDPARVGRFFSMNWTLLVLFWVIGLPLSDLAKRPR